MGIFMGKLLCDENITSEEGRNYCFCQYCGSKIVLVNENEHVYVYERVDEAEIKSNWRKKKK